jgi:hypothetical protein
VRGAGDQRIEDRGSGRICVPSAGLDHRSCAVGQENRECLFAVEATLEDTTIAASLYCITNTDMRNQCGLSRMLREHPSSCYVPAVVAGEEIGMDHPIVDVFAFQEALLIEALFGIALLAMIWVGFRRWLQHKEKMGRLIAEQTAERSAQYGAQMERVEARLKVVEQNITDGGVQTVAEIDARRTKPLSGRS